MGTTFRVVRDLGLALVLGVVLAIPPILLALWLDPAMAVSRFNPLAGRQAYGMKVPSPDDARVLELAEAIRATLGDGRARVEVWTDDEGVWLETVTPPGEAIGPAVSSTVQSSGLWNGRVRLHAARPLSGDIPIEDVGPLLPGFFAATALAFLIVAARKRRRHPRPAWERPRGTVRQRVLGGVAGGVGLLVLVMLLDALLGAVGFEQREQPLVVALARSEGITLAVFVLAVAMLAPVGEELFFRGWMFRELAAAGHPGRAYVVTTVLFALVHLNPAALPLYLAYGAGLGWIYGATRWVWSPVIAHGLVNTTAIALLLAGRP